MCFLQQSRIKDTWSPGARDPLILRAGQSDCGVRPVGEGLVEAGSVPHRGERAAATDIEI